MTLCSLNVSNYQQTDKVSVAGDGLLPQTGPGLAPGPQPGMGIFAMMGETVRHSSWARLRPPGSKSS